MNPFPEKDLDFLVRQTRLILSSYRHWKGKSFWPEEKSGEILAHEIFYAPFVLCSAGNEQDPVLNYGNQKALDLWQMDWNTFTRTPGQKTAEPMERAARDRFLIGRAISASQPRVSTLGTKTGSAFPWYWKILSAIYAGFSPASNDFSNGAQAWQPGAPQVFPIQFMQNPRLLPEPFSSRK